MQLAAFGTSCTGPCNAGRRRRVTAHLLPGPSENLPLSPLSPPSRRFRCCFKDDCTISPSARVQFRLYSLSLPRMQHHPRPPHKHHHAGSSVYVRLPTSILCSHVLIQTAQLPSTSMSAYRDCTRRSCWLNLSSRRYAQRRRSC